MHNGVIVNLRRYAKSRLLHRIFGHAGHYISR